ncbi:MAG: TraR/DksA C4-type zinc finger protein [Verrucomicrobiota bacterium]
MAKKTAHQAKKAAVRKPAASRSLPKTAVSSRANRVARIASDLRKIAKLRAPKGIKRPPPEREEKFILKKVFKKSQLTAYKQVLERLRDRVVDEISFLAGDNLNRSQKESSGDLSSYSFHMADQGTDNFDREFALNLVSSEQDVLYEIDDALRRIDLGNYGVCELCGKAIEKARLGALPFAKLCIGCKSEAEKGKTRFRPFGPTISQTAES